MISVNYRRLTSYAEYIAIICKCRWLLYYVNYRYDVDQLLIRYKWADTGGKNPSLMLHR